MRRIVYQRITGSKRNGLLKHAAILLAFILLAVVGGCAMNEAGSSISTGHENGNIFDDTEFSTLTLGNSIPLDFDTEIDSMFKLPWLYEIKSLAPSDIKEIWMEETVGDCQVFFYTGNDQCSYVGAETANGCYTLFQIDNSPLNPPVYFDTYKVLEFDNILGAKGFKVTLLIGLHFELTAYYVEEEGHPVLFAYANLAIETDLDDDGDLEVISTHPSMMPTCYVIKAFDGVIKWSSDVKKVLSANRGVEFDEETKVFSAFWSEDEDQNIDNPDKWIYKSYMYSDDKLIEIYN